MKFRMGLIALVLMVWFCSPLLAAEVRQELAKQSTLEQVIGKNQLRVGFSTFVPWFLTLASSLKTAFRY